MAGLCLLLSTCVIADESLRQRVEAMQAGFVPSAAGEPLMARQALTNFYAERQFELAWLETDDREALLAALDSMGQDGLNPADYHQLPLTALLSRQFEDMSSAERVDLDLLLSDAFFMMGSHLLEGKVNPETIDAEWLANRRQRAMAPILARALQEHAVGRELDDVRPAQTGYRKLKQLRAYLVQMTDLPWPPIPDGASLKPGMTDARLAEVRHRLTQLRGLYGMAPAGANAESSIIENYDPPLVALVKIFQAHNGLEDDGVVGRDTLRALNRTPAELLRLIDLNLERWRWLPDSLGDPHVMVNAAGYELTLVVKGEVTLRKRVIVGRPFRRTPVFSDSIRYLVFNPTWTVPGKLIIEDKLPEIIRDPTYLQRLGFSIYRGWGAERQRVDPGGIDWRATSASRFPYQLVQAPGPMNALGQVKFMFPNKFDVYLHDTPSRDLFRKSERSFSSGCIRVEEPLELAAHLLALAGDPGWGAGRIEETVRSKRTVTVNLKKPIPVHLEYWTAWSDDNGQPQFRKDIYERDERLYRALTSRVPVTGLAGNGAVRDAGLLSQK
ncbi:L,D-transpeptidase family protein [Marinobacter caseinilyticus]|uniref:L,D-transpeptidase family protein n=1 Tax=Marinobacter caseinilyticus TaxID=2692195 RepID=UPI001EFF89E1|nr:L,D-transpeptidase family protein [Marinobacter caseinilyticus]